jgi:hypothetical protein
MKTTIGFTMLITALSMCCINIVHASVPPEKADGKTPDQTLVEENPLSN